jgi:hypothetical protein
MVKVAEVSKEVSVVIFRVKQSSILELLYPEYEDTTLFKTPVTSDVPRLKTSST